jgi:cobalamin biosynthesis protein CobW
MSKTPVTIITGFLGAGKTTLIRHLLQNAGGRKLALIINEFGDVGIDGDLVKGCNDTACPVENIVELANGCICCTVADDFLPTIEALLDRADKPDHIIIETSGLALPKPLVKAFQWPSVRTRATVDAVIAMIDADAVTAGRFAPNEAALAAMRAEDPTLDHETPLEELFEEQLGCADMVILNKCDLLTAEQIAAVEAIVHKDMRAGTGIVHASGGAVDPTILFGHAAAAEDDLDSRPSHHDGAPDDHDHDDFDSFVVQGGDVADPQAFVLALGAIIADHDILRIKGFASASGKQARLVIQAVGPRIQHFFDRPWSADELRQTSLVVIGEKGLNEAAITAAIQAELS